MNSQGTTPQQVPVCYCANSLPLTARLAGNVGSCIVHFRIPIQGPYFALETENWTLIYLDTARPTWPLVADLPPTYLDEVQLDWVFARVKDAKAANRCGWWMESDDGLLSGDVWILFRFEVFFSSFIRAPGLEYPELPTPARPAPCAEKSSCSATINCFPPQSRSGYTTKPSRASTRISMLNSTPSCLTSQPGFGAMNIPWR